VKSHIRTKSEIGIIQVASYSLSYPVQSIGASRQINSDLPGLLAGPIPRLQRREFMELEDITSSPNSGESSTPILKLSNDLLENIFLLITTDVDVPVHERASTVLFVSHTCRIWRTVALQYPIIWAHIIDYHRHSVTWINELLQRSHPVPFEFGSRTHKVMFQASSGERGFRVLQLVLNHASS